MWKVRQSRLKRDAQGPTGWPSQRSSIFLAYRRIPFTMSLTKALVLRAARDLLLRRSPSLGLTSSEMSRIV